MNSCIEGNSDSTCQLSGKCSDFQFCHFFSAVWDTAQCFFHPHLQCTVEHIVLRSLIALGRWSGDIIGLFHFYFLWIFALFLHLSSFSTCFRLETFFFFRGREGITSFWFQTRSGKWVLVGSQRKSIKKINTESVFSKVICISCTLGS